MAEIGTRWEGNRRADPAARTGRQADQGLKSIPIRGQIANEVIDLAYGFFTPLEASWARRISIPSARR
jgi:hypothetical protein